MFYVNDNFIYFCSLSYPPVIMSASSTLIGVFLLNFDRRASDKADWIEISWILLRRSSSSFVVMDLKKVVIGCSIPS